MGIDRTEWSPTLQRKIVWAGTTNSSFAKGSADLQEYLDLQVDPKQVERVTERIGRERCVARDAAVQAYVARPLVERKGQPEGVTVPAVAVVSVDGGRLQIRPAAKPKPAVAAKPKPPAEAATPPAVAAKPKPLAEAATPPAVGTEPAPAVDPKPAVAATPPAVAATPPAVAAKPKPPVEAATPPAVGTEPASAVDTRPAVETKPNPPVEAAPPPAVGTKPAPAVDPPPAMDAKPPAEAATPLAVDTRSAGDVAGPAEESLADDQHRGKHWREDKIGLLMTMTSVVQAADPCPEVLPAFVDPTRIVQLARELKTKKAAHQEAVAESEKPEAIEQVLRDEGREVRWEPPEVEDKRLTATRRPWAEFGPMVAQTAWQLGFYAAERRAFVGDGSDHVWTVHRQHFSSFVPILDIIHAISYVFAAAMAGRSFVPGWNCYVRWMKWVWQGEVAKVIAELAQRQAELGAPQESDGETHPRRVVHTALGYLRNHQDKMDYPEYRRQGLPITSSYVESAVKQFNARVKGTEKFWTERGAEALLCLRADYLSTGSVVADFWQARQDNATGQTRYALGA